MTRYFTIFIGILGTGVGAILGVITNKPDALQCPDPPPPAEGIRPKLDPPTVSTWPDYPRISDVPVHPPKEALIPWKVFVGRGLVKDTFSEVPNHGIQLAMPYQNSWDCYLSPLEVRPVGRPRRLRPVYWVVSRAALCSNDLWVTSVRSDHAAIVSMEGVVENPQDRLMVELQEKDGEITTVILSPSAGKTDDRARQLYIQDP